MKRLFSLKDAYPRVKRSVSWSQNNQDNLALGKHYIRFAIAPGATSIASPTLQKKDEKEIIYNLNGQRVDKASARGGIFISSQKGKFYKASGSSRGR